MPEVAYAGEDHRHAVLIRGCDHFIVALRAAVLYDCADAIFCRHIHSIAEGEEGIRSHDRAAHLELLIRGLHCRDTAGIDAAHLTGADADRRAPARVHDGIRFHELAYAPGEEQ